MTAGFLQFPLPRFQVCNVHLQSVINNDSPAHRIVDGLQGIVSEADLAGGWLARLRGRPAAEEPAAS